MKLQISVIISIYFLFVSSNCLFASNIGRNVYSILTETYAGIKLDDASAGDDRAVAYTGSMYSNDTDKVEGTKSYYSSNWFSVAFFSDTRDMSAYSKLCFSVKVKENSSDQNFETKFAGCQIKLEDISSTEAINLNSNSIIRTDATSGESNTGIKRDGQWHTYYIPLSSFSGLDLTKIKCPFILGSAMGNYLLIDNVYMKKDTEGTFAIKIKNLSNNQRLADDANITFSQSSFRNGWQSAQQYLEIAFDKEIKIPSQNCYIQIYTDNGSKSRNGMYNIENNIERVLTMCFRASDTLLSATATAGSNTDSVLIAQGAGGLYDKGKNLDDPQYYTWIYMLDKAKLDEGDTNQFQYSKVWDISSGLHMSEGASYYKMLDGTKIYLGANCADALGGLVYRASIVISAVYE